MPELIREPGWGEASGRRVVIEAANWSHRQALSQLLTSAGYATSACPGPAGADERCPMVAGQGCAAVDEADVVVHALHPSDHRNRELLLAHRRQLPDTPLIVEVPARVAERRPEDYEGCIVVHSPMKPADLLAAVEAALGD